MSTSVKIGFLGLGAMGLGMASHLAKKGFDVAGYDVNPQAMTQLVEEGGHDASSPRSAASGRDVLIVVVATSNQASKSLLDPKEGAIAGLSEESTIILCITAPPEYIIQLKRCLVSAGRPDIKLIDCPISGGEVRAWAGDLSLICSGEDDDIANVRHILQCIGSQLHLIPRGIGRGSSVKMAHQILVGVHILASVEVMGLCAIAGLDPQAVYDSVEESDGYSWLFGQRAAHMIDQSKVPASSLRIITKDFAMLNQSARMSKFPLPLASLAYQIFLQTSAAGHTNDDCKTLDMYLSGRGEVDVFPVIRTNAQTSDDVIAKAILDILVGIHSSVAIEALEYAQRLGVQASTMKAVVNDAAGSSVMFVKIASQLQDHGDQRISLQAIEDFDSITQRLSNGVQAAASLGYPTFLASAALQQFHTEKSI